MAPAIDFEVVAADNLAAGSSSCLAVQAVAGRTAHVFGLHSWAFWVAAVGIADSVTVGPAWVEAVADNLHPLAATRAHGVEPATDSAVVLRA